MTRSPIENQLAAVQGAVTASTDELKQLQATIEKLNGATEPGPPDSYPGTPGEFAARWNGWTSERRAEWLAASIASAELASTCLIMHPQRRPQFATGGYIQSSPFEYLQGLCRAHGMSDNDSRSAITTYLVHGSLTAYDRQLLRGLTAAERDAVLAARYGSDAARVAHIVLTEGPV